MACTQTARVTCTNQQTKEMEFSSTGNCDDGTPCKPKVEETDKKGSTRRYRGKLGKRVDYECECKPKAK